MCESGSELLFSQSVSKLTVTIFKILMKSEVILMNDIHEYFDARAQQAVGYCTNLSPVSREVSRVVSKNRFHR